METFLDHYRGTFSSEAQKRARDGVALITETHTAPCTHCIHMSTIRVTDDVKERLRDLKRDDESFNDLLDRLSRSEKDVEAIAESLPPVDEEDVEQMDEARERLNESLENRR